MASPSSLLKQVCEAQSWNSTLDGQELRRAARALAALSTEGQRALLAVDEAGERVIGAVLASHDDVRTVDKSRRLDGMPVLLVAGHIAGPTAISMKARYARSLGAMIVEAAVLGTCTTPIVGCERVTSLSQERHLVAL